jgi:hypothetical protein
VILAPAETLAFPVVLCVGAVLAVVARTLGELLREITPQTIADRGGIAAACTVSGARVTVSKKSDKIAFWKMACGGGLVASFVMRIANPQMHDRGHEALVALFHALKRGQGPPSRRRSNPIRLLATGWHNAQHPCTFFLRNTRMTSYHDLIS